MSGISLFWIVGFAIAAFYGVTSVIYPKRARASRFADREELSLDEIFSRFYERSGVPKDLVTELWKEAATALGIPGGKLRPTDRLDIELGPIKGFPLVDLNEEFCDTMIRRLRRHNAKAAPAELKPIKSLNDYINFFGKLELSSKEK